MRLALSLLAAFSLCSCGDESSSPGFRSPAADAASDAAADAADATVEGAAGHAGSPDAGDASPGDSPWTDAPAPDAGPPDDLALIKNTSGWQIYGGGGYRYGPSIHILDDDTIDMWMSSPGSGGAWDFIRYRHSTDGGHTWTADEIVLQPTAGSRDAFSVCDPGVIRIGAFWYIGYTSTENSKGTENHLYVARGTSPKGPFEKWNGTGWGGNPQPIVTYTGSPDSYGIGEPSFVLADRLFVYYSNTDVTSDTDVAVVEPPVGEDWPAHLVQHGVAIARRDSAEDSTDIKYVDTMKRFVGVATIDRFGPNSSIAAYQSLDGLSFEPVPFRGARVQQGAHNVGISGSGDGHLDTSRANFISYSYNPPGSTWGDWPTFLDPVALSATPRGLPVWGKVSSIVGGANGVWDWSGPRAWDGETSTVFSSDSHGATADAEEWAFVDLGAPYPITGLTIHPRPDGMGFPVDFTLQSSTDAKSWTDIPGEVFTAFANPGAQAVERTFGTPATARYVRLHATRLGADNFGNHYLQLAELTAHIQGL
jgi:hypothetical protein